MSTLINEIDARTRLAGANQMELLLFHLGTQEVFGINVFKVREVVKLPQLTRVPDADSRVIGMANIRGTMVPVIALKRSLGLGEYEVDRSKPEAKGNGILIVTEYNASLQAFHVAAVDRIIRTSWSQIKPPPALVCENNQGAVTAVTMLDNGRMVLILDVEKLLSDICHRSDEEVYAGVTTKPELKTKTVLFADDSTVARTQIRKALEKLGVLYVQTTTGKEAWDYLQQLAENSAKEGLPNVQCINMVLSDIEMPDMDGFTLTKQIRADPRLAHLPVILHSSLTGTCNQDKGRQVGATDYITKFDPKLFVEQLMRYIK